MKAVVFEVSFEVANKVGGIHTVLSTKAGSMMGNFDDYYVVGPYYKDKAKLEFEEEHDNPFADSFRELEEQGIKCYYGRWLIEGKPKCILVEPGALSDKKDGIKAGLWEKYKVDSIKAGWDYDEPVVWSEAAGIALEKIISRLDAQVVCQFHEWLTGAALLHLKTVNSKAALAFTTHATMLGRSMAGNGMELCEDIEKGLAENRICDDKIAKKLGMLPKHSMEKACARETDVFTSVSATTGREAQYILGKKPDILTLNGLNIRKFPSMEELSLLHDRYKERVKHFCLAYFTPYYHMDVENTLYFFIAGRFEYRNKGIDLLIDSLHRLNERLKTENSPKNVVVFFWVPDATEGRNQEVMGNISMFNGMLDEIESNLEEIRENILDSVCAGEIPESPDIFDETFIKDLKKRIIQRQRGENASPPLSALNLSNKNNIILKNLVEKGLTNKADDKVKIVYYPAYLSSADGLLGLNYESGIMACHLGIFPSYYEPWGYTPVETAGRGVLSVTTDLAGFGKFIKEFIHDDKPAIKVIKREGVPYEESMKELSDYMYYVLNTERKERVMKKIEAKGLSELTDWKNLIKNYIDAYKIAFEKAKQRTNNG